MRHGSLFFLLNNSRTVTSDVCHAVCLSVTPKGFVLKIIVSANKFQNYFYCNKSNQTVTPKGLRRLKINCVSQ